MQPYALAMITTLMPHLRIGPYKEGVTIDQIQMPFHAVGRSFSYELLAIPSSCYRLLCLNVGFSGHRMTHYSRTGSKLAKQIRGVLYLSLMFAILDFHS